MFSANQLQQVLKQRFTVQRSLAKGRFGTAYLVKDGSDFKVVKRIELDTASKEDMTKVLAEGSLHSALSHPNVVSYYDSFMHQDAFYIVTEYCDGGDLRTKIKEQKATGNFFDEKTISDWFVQLMRAVEYIHERHVIHRDISTGNVFLTKNGLVKLGDFGSSRILRNSLDVATSFIGTPLYMSPEMLNLEDYDSKTDIWSCGCVLYELCTLATLFTVQGVISLSIEAHRRIMPHLPSDRYSSELDRVFQGMVAKDPKVRISGTDVLRSLAPKSDLPRRRRRRRRLRNISSMSSSFSMPIDPETQRWFSELDTDKNGHIDTSEIQAALFKGEGRSFDAKSTLILFELFDINHDDVFELNEFAEIVDFINRKRKEFEAICSGGKMDAATFATAIEANLGYKFSQEVINLTVEKFGVRNFIYSDGYLIASAFFKVRDAKFPGDSQPISFDQFVNCCLVSH